MAIIKKHNPTECSFLCGGNRLFAGTKFFPVHGLESASSAEINKAMNSWYAGLKKRPGIKWGVRILGALRTLKRWIVGQRSDSIRVIIPEPIRGAGILFVKPAVGRLTVIYRCALPDRSEPN